MVSVLTRWPVILLVVLLSPAVSLSEQVTSRIDGISGRSPAPMPDGQRITVSDGDTIVIEGDARVRIIRRRPAFVRIIANVEQRFAIVITENLRQYGDSPTRLSDKTYEFNGLREQWPFAARWEGTVWLEEYFQAGSPPGAPMGMLGIETTEAKIVFANRGPAPSPALDANTTAVGFQGIVIGGGGQQPFDQEEARALAMAAQNGARRAQGGFGLGSNGMGFSSSMSTTTGPVGPPPSRAPAAPDGAIRVGGNIAPPRKIHHVDPVMPEQASAARVQGIVIVEITVGPDGAVKDARILRSIPLLDQAALDAVRQWRFEPPLVNGQAAPVVMTTPVSFGPV